jgi:hypothetical protein
MWSHCLRFQAPINYQTLQRLKHKESSKQKQRKST